MLELLLLSTWLLSIAYGELTFITINSTKQQKVLLDLYTLYLPHSLSHTYKTFQLIINYSESTHSSLYASNSFVTFAVFVVIFSRFNFFVWKIQSDIKFVFVKMSSELEPLIVRTERITERSSKCKLNFIISMASCFALFFFAQRDSHCWQIVLSYWIIVEMLFIFETIGMRLGYRFYWKFVIFDY